MRKFKKCFQHFIKIITPAEDIAQQVKQYVSILTKLRTDFRVENLNLDSIFLNPFFSLFYTFVDRSIRIFFWIKLNNFYLILNGLFNKDSNLIDMTR